jgi:undecaprenyl diphosphate synthase
MSPTHTYAPGYLEQLRVRFPQADPLSRLPDVEPARIPRHIAIIMDGNGRWAAQRGFPREFGHRNGAAAIRAVLTECELLGIEMLTLYSFSIENWKRPEREVDFLMQLAALYFDGEREALKRKNIRCKVIGRREGLPPDVLAAIDRTVAETFACTGPTLCLALNYGARAEIVDAAKALARNVAAGRIDPDAIDEALFASMLYTAEYSDPDLLIRTAGDFRVSNYLLWQISYAEIHVTDTLWPDFGAADLHAAIRDFARRDRRFGGVPAR